MAPHIDRADAAHYFSLTPSRSVAGRIGPTVNSDLVEAAQIAGAKGRRQFSGNVAWPGPTGAGGRGINSALRKRFEFGHAPPFGLASAHVQTLFDPLLGHRFEVGQVGRGPMSLGILLVIDIKFDVSVSARVLYLDRCIPMRHHRKGGRGRKRF